MHAGSLKVHTHAGSLKMHICPGSLMLYRSFCIETEFQCGIHSAAFIKLPLVPKIIFTGNFNLCLYPINITSHSSSFVALYIWVMAAQFMDPFLYPIPDITNLRNLLPIAVCCFTIRYFSWLGYLYLCQLYLYIVYIYILSTLYLKHWSGRQNKTKFKHKTELLEDLFWDF